MPQADTILVPRTLRACSTSGPGIGAPAHRKVRRVGTAWPVSATVRARSVRNGVEAIVKRGALGADQLDRLLRLPDVLQHGAGAQHDRHHQAVHEAGLVRHGRGHQHHVVRAQAQALGVGNDVGHRGVGRVHHALGLAGGARGVDQLRHIVRAGPVAREDLLRVGLVLPGRAAEQALEAVGARAADHHDLLQVGQARLQPSPSARSRSRGRSSARSRPWLRRASSMNDSSRSRKMCISGFITAPMREQAR